MNIVIPPTTRQRIEALLMQQQALQGQINAIIDTARDLLNVPDTYVLRNIAVGFEPPPPGEDPPQA